MRYRPVWFYPNGFRQRTRPRPCRRRPRAAVHDVRTGFSAKISAVLPNRQTLSFGWPAAPISELSEMRLDEENAVVCTVSLQDTLLPASDEVSSFFASDGQKRSLQKWATSRGKYEFKGEGDWVPKLSEIFVGPGFDAKWQGFVTWLRHCLRTRTMIAEPPVLPIRYDSCCLVQKIQALAFWLQRLRGESVGFALTWEQHRRLKILMQDRFGEAFKPKILDKVLRFRLKTPSLRDFLEMFAVDDRDIMEGI
jgi:hypothetical protein